MGDLFLALVSVVAVHLVFHPPSVRTWRGCGEGSRSPCWSSSCPGAAVCLPGNSCCCTRVTPARVTQQHCTTVGGGSCRTAISSVVTAVSSYFVRIFGHCTISKKVEYYLLPILQSIFSLFAQHNDN